MLTQLRCKALVLLQNNACMLLHTGHTIDLADMAATLEQLYLLLNSSACSGRQKATEHFEHHLHPSNAQWATVTMCC